MNQELTETNSGVPAWMKKASTGQSFGELDATDLKPPRLKMLAGMSPEVMDGVPGATPGNFWITILNLNLGQTVVGTPIYLRKSYQLWAPKSGGEQKGPLATADAKGKWDVPDQSFEIKFPGNPKVYTWEIMKNVSDNGMDKFGSSQDDNPRSQPAAALTYDVLWLIDLPNGKKQLCVFTNSKTGLTPTQKFITASELVGVDRHFQRYRIVTVKKIGPTNDPYFTYDYQYINNIQDEEEGKVTQAIYAQYAKKNFSPDFEEESERLHVQKVQGDYAKRREHPFLRETAPLDDDIPF
jgi:hypothetical protein